MATCTAALIADELLASLGTELTIFAVTLTVTLAMNKIVRYGRRKAKKDKKTADAPAAPAKANSDATHRPPPPPRSVSDASRPSRQPASAQPAAQAPTGCAKPPAPPARGALSWEPRQLINEVMDVVAENKSMKSATRALTLYSKLQQTLDAPGAPSMANAAQGSSHTAVDFFATVLQCAVRVGRFDIVGGVVEDMVKHDVPRSLSFYEVAMKQLAAQKQYRAALSMYDRLAADGLQASLVTYSCLIGFAAEVGELQRAVDFFEKLSMGTTPSIRAYMTVLRVHAKRQDWSASLALFHDMRTRGVRPDSLVLNFVLATGVASDQLEAASAFLEEIDCEAPPISDVVSYNTLIKGFAQRGNADAAMEAILRMRKRGLRPNSITFNTTMDAAVRGNRCSEAWKVLAAMRVERLRPDKFSCSILVKGLAKAAPPDQIQSSLELLAEVGSTCDATLLSSLYHIVLDAAAAGPNKGLLSKTFAQMRRFRVQPSAAAQQLLVHTLAHSEAPWRRES